MLPSIICDSVQLSCAASSGTTATMLLLRNMLYLSHAAATACGNQSAWRGRLTRVPMRSAVGALQNAAAASGAEWQELSDLARQVWDLKGLLTAAGPLEVGRPFTPQRLLDALR